MTVPVRRLQKVTPIATERARRTRKRIHDAARQAFAELGTGAQIDDVIRGAGIARGTFYNYYRTTEELFEAVAAELAEDLASRIDQRILALPDPAQRLSNGIRHFCMQAHADRDWGRFLVHFGLSAETLQAALRHPALRDIEAGIAAGRFRIEDDQVLSALALVIGAVLSAIKLIVSGMESPVRAGENVVEMVLHGFGLPAREAASLARQPLMALDTAASR